MIRVAAGAAYHICNTQDLLLTRPLVQLPKRETRVTNLLGKTVLSEIPTGSFSPHSDNLQLRLCTAGHKTVHCNVVLGCKQHRLPPRGNP